MIEGLIGKKIGMTRIFVEGANVPVTVIEAGKCQVTQKKTKETDGYDALQIGFAPKKEQRTSQAMQGHFKKSGSTPYYQVKEFGCASIDDFKAGQEISLGDVFEVGDFVDITGTSKGKGFAGVMKRWNFAGGPGSHGSKHGRGPGSIGQSASPSKVIKGMKMPGHMGNAKTTTQNLKVVGIRQEDNVILVKGAVPGSINGYITIKKALKKR